MSKKIHEHLRAICPSPQFHIAVRSGFVSVGESLNKWCLTKGYHNQNVRLALMGEWKGPRATELCEEVYAYLQTKGVCL